MGTRRILAIVVASALLSGLAGLVVVWQTPSPVEASLAVVDDDGRFTTALDASDAFAEISGLLDDVECDARRDESCARTLRAAAWARVTAVLIVGCTPPGVHEARAGLARYLRGGGDLPSTPRCGIRRQSPSS